MDKLLRLEVFAVAIFIDMGDSPRGVVATSVAGQEQNSIMIPERADDAEYVERKCGEVRDELVG